MVVHPAALFAAATLFVKAVFSSDCVAAASAQAKFLAANRDATTVRIPAIAAYDCISSIPLQEDYSAELLNSLKAWIQFESQVDYLKDPSQGYLWEPIDILAELDRISDDVQNKRYSSQY